MATASHTRFLKPDRMLNLKTDTLIIGALPPLIDIGDSATKVTAPAFERFAHYGHEPADYFGALVFVVGPVRKGRREILCGKSNVVGSFLCLSLPNPAEQM